MPKAKRTSYRHKCPQCDVIFESVHKNQRFCSHTCAANSQHNMLTLVCHGCGVEFERVESKTYEGYRYYCTRECYMKSHAWKKAKRENIGDAILALKELLDIFPDEDYTKLDDSQFG